jgi:hypothetical protein
MQMLVPDFAFYKVEVPITNGWKFGNVLMIPAKHNRKSQDCYIVGFSSPLSDSKREQSYPSEIYPMLWIKKIWNSLLLWENLEVMDELVMVKSLIILK